MAAAMHLFGHACVRARQRAQSWDAMLSLLFARSSCLDPCHLNFERRNTQSPRLL